MSGIYRSNRGGRQLPLRQRVPPKPPGQSRSTLREALSCLEREFGTSELSFRQGGNGCDTQRQGLGRSDCEIKNQSRRSSPGPLRRDRSQHDCRSCGPRRGLISKLVCLHRAFLFRRVSGRAKARFVSKLRRGRFRLARTPLLKLVYVRETKIRMATETLATQAPNILHDWVQSDSLRKHCY